ncbi:hypothetical protein I552_7336 [Mycobacterium xenopi 3993]|nr:hypothetical protein I552_7336 [Mycobacterium xenopi 3993]
MALGGQPARDGAQLGRIGRVDGHHQRFARGDHLRRQPVQKTAVMPEPQRLQT